MNFAQQLIFDLIESIIMNNKRGTFVFYSAFPFGKTFIYEKVSKHDEVQIDNYWKPTYVTFGIFCL
jgi:hypothetical protein